MGWVWNTRSGGPSSSLGGTTGTLTLAGGTLLYYGPGETATRTIAMGTTGTIDASGSGPLTISNVTNSVPGAKALNLRGFNTGLNTITATLACSKSGRPSFVFNRVCPRLGFRFMVSRLPTTSHEIAFRDTDEGVLNAQCPVMRQIRHQASDNRILLTVIFQ